MLKKIDFSQIEGLSAGNAQDDKAKTGVTVFVFPETAIAACDVSGGGPASREVPVVDVEKNDVPVNAIILAGGSAFGLAAADGVMKCLEEHSMGYDTHFAKVPIVVQSDIYDLSYGSSDVRPDSDMGYKACSNALNKNSPVSGNVGGGCGATAGKIGGMKRAQKSGIGYAACSLGNLKVGAAVVVNSFGDVFSKGKKICGLMNEERSGYCDFMEEFYQAAQSRYSEKYKNTNTTIGAVFTNGNFTKSDLKKIAVMARAAYGKCIVPCGTMGDGDTIYAASCGPKTEADVNLAGLMAVEAMESAIADAVESSRISDEEYLANIK
ncbi:P1 family peptidase [Treponema sp.]|uniref:P1 family peptidase n=1 Tax=Treponema sp. TaxID=166 RepID=UPI0025E9DD5B|nr:P1 family peptidase [Treponema sp.]MCR5217951.1 P1 family peptidase [Treponema sp.]